MEPIHASCPRQGAARVTVNVELLDELEADGTDTDGDVDQLASTFDPRRHGALYCDIDKAVDGYLNHAPSGPPSLCLARRGCP